MKSEYIEIVPVRFNELGKVYLFQTRGFNHLYKGNIVSVEGSDSFATVLADSETVKLNTDEYKWYVDAFGATEPLKKILGVFKEIKYYEEGAEE